MSLPLVLISQIQRSGGTLLSQLIEGHPECWTYPHELKVGPLVKWDWPDLPLDATPHTWFGLLFDKRLKRLARAGYTKPGRNPHAREHVLPFTFDIDRFKVRFLDLCQQTAVRSQRDVLDQYFEAFFQAWVDRADTGEERCVVAFTPRVHMTSGSLERYRRDYPHGRMISLIRDPWTWWASASRHCAEYGVIDLAMDLWRESAEASMRLEASSPGTALVLLYEELVREPRRVMTEVARFLGIAWHECLLRPTYCGHVMIPNSSFPIRDAGLTQEPLTRALDLAPEVRAYIEDTAGPLYRACAAQIRGSGVPEFLSS